MNKVNLIGNLVANPELRYSNGETQTAICRFRIAVNDGYGEKQRTSFIPITVFGKSAENCERYLAKGSKVAISGKIQTGSYDKDGVTVYTTDIIADTYGGVEFLSGGGSGSKDNSPQNEQKTPQSEPSGFSKLSEEDVPF